MLARALAAAQTVPFRGDVSANIRQHLRLVEAAADANAQAFVFPELSLTGYELDLAEGLAFSEGDARLGPLVKVASSRRMTLIVGAPVRIGSSLYMGAFIISSAGVDLYTKHHLGAFPTRANPDGPVPPAEATVFQPGDRNPLVSLGGATAAIAVCADTSRASHPEAAARRGATSYLASMFIIPSDFDEETARLQSYASQHSMAVVFGNYGGPTGGLPSAGGSSIWSENGALLVQLPQNGAGVAVAIDGEDGWQAKTVMIEG